MPARRNALTRRAAHDDSDTITQLIDAKEAELADADAVTTTKTTTTMPNYVEQANYFDGDRPAPAWELAQTNFLKQGATILGQVAEPSASRSGTRAPCPRRWVWSCRTRPSRRPSGKERRRAAASTRIPVAQAL